MTEPDEHDGVASEPGVRVRSRPWVGRAALVYFVVSTIALVAPVYTTFGNAIEPRVLGIPWSLAYVLGVVTANATVLAILYVGRWVDGDEPTGVPGGPP